MNQKFVHEIDEVLRTAQSAAELTERVFGVGGLVGRLAPSKKERKHFVESPLYEKLQARLHELHAAEEEQFARGLLRDGVREAVVGPCGLTKIGLGQLDRQDVPERF